MSANTPVVLRSLRQKAAQKGESKRSSRSSQPGAPCVACAHPLRAAMRFCSRCGASQGGPSPAVEVPATPAARSLSAEVLSPRSGEVVKAHSAEVLLPEEASSGAGSDADDTVPPRPVKTVPVSIVSQSQPLPMVNRKLAPPGAAGGGAAGGPARPAKTWLSKVTARRAMSTGPTPAHNPVTGEFMALLSSSDEGTPTGAPGTPEGTKVRKKKRPDTVARALPHVLPPVARRMTREEVFSGQEGGINLPELRNHFRREGRLEEEAAATIATMATRILGREKNLLHLRAPLSIVGDIHGQYFDLLVLLEKLDFSSPVLFLGDFVDRGYFGCEVALYLLALKIEMPDKVFLIRGNHESRQVTQMYNFERECKASKLFYGFISYSFLLFCLLFRFGSGSILGRCGRGS
jgi:hypothetical protein